MREALLGAVGLCMGMTIASGVVAFIISLGIVPRFAGITRSATRVRLYEDCSMVGAVLGICSFSTRKHCRLEMPDLPFTEVSPGFFWEAGW